MTLFQRCSSSDAPISSKKYNPSGKTAVFDRFGGSKEWVISDNFGEFAEKSPSDVLSKSGELIFDNACQSRHFTASEDIRGSSDLSLSNVCSASMPVESRPLDPHSLHRPRWSSESPRQSFGSFSKISIFAREIFEVKRLERQRFCSNLNF
jgi:hypothetical protein